MTRQSAFALLREHLRALQDALRNLMLALDDVPDPEVEPAIVDAMRNSASEVESALAPALRAEGGDAAAALHCQEALHQMQQSTYLLASHENMLELSRLAAERGGAWRRWSDVVRDALEACQETLHLVSDGLLGLWRELVAEGL